MSSKEAHKYLCGHYGYIKYANCYNLVNKLFEVENQGQIKNSTNRVKRGGNANNSTADYPASYRNNNSTGNTNYNLGFRAVL